MQMLDDPCPLSLPDGLVHEHEAVPGATRASEADRKVQGVGTVTENAEADLVQRRSHVVERTLDKGS